MANLTPPPIVDALFEQKKLGSTSWIIFFQNLYDTVKSLSGSGSGSNVTGSIPFYTADGSQHNIPLVSS